MEASAALSGLPLQKRLGGCPPLISFIQVQCICCFFVLPPQRLEGYPSLKSQIVIPCMINESFEWKLLILYAGQMQKNNDLKNFFNKILPLSII